MGAVVVVMVAAVVVSVSVAAVRVVMNFVGIGGGCDEKVGIIKTLGKVGIITTLGY